MFAESKEAYFTMGLLPKRKTLIGSWDCFIGRLRLLGRHVLVWGTGLISSIARNSPFKFNMGTISVIVNQFFA